MTTTLKKSLLCDLVSRHSNFDFDTFIANTPLDEYDSWNGYCLPMFYSNAEKEYDAIRNSCALFDVSPMKKYCFRGADAGKFLDRILTAPVSQLSAMRAAYGLICNEQGLLIDDGIVNKYADDDYCLLVSEMDLDQHFADSNDFSDLTITEETALLAGLAVQGPKSCAVLSQFGFSGVENLEPFELKHFDLAGHKILVGRLGFTGDLGYEIWFSPDAIDTIGQAILDSETALDIQLAGYGLTALQVCRIQAGMIVPGWDTAAEFTNPDNERTPYELTLGWNVKLAREEDFVGKAALTQLKINGLRYRMKGFTIDSQCSIADGQPLFTKIEGVPTQIGSLPSVVWHASENLWLGFASIKIAHADITDVYIIDDAKEVSCNLGNTTFIDLERRNQLPAPT